jgi:hypothetical protein
MTVIESPPPFVSQLLAVYNRRFHPLTIRTHVEHLRKRGFVWWGRFRADAGRLSTAEARAEWPHIAALADDRLAAGEPTALFVTNYEALHVCKVTHIVLGDDPESEVRREALPYYGDHSVPIWFRVEDVRALSYDMTTTDDWFNSRLGVVLSGSKRRRKAAGTFDPYATAENAYPTLDDARLKRDGGGGYFDELLGCICDIRSSEKVFWRKVLEIYATSIDYDASVDASKRCGMRPSPSVRAASPSHPPDRAFTMFVRRSLPFSQH